VDKNLNVLIVDDDPGVRESYRDILAPAAENDLLAMGATLFKDVCPEPVAVDRPRYRLTLVERGDAAVAAVAASRQCGNPFALAFVDMQMPGIDGAETTRRIRQIDPRARIVIVTAYSEYTPDDIIRVVCGDDIFYLRKPFNSEEIRQFARALTNEWQLERERERLTSQLEGVNAELADMNQNLLTRVQAQARMLIQSEKMASIGILAAGVAHEINNPMAFINANLTALKTYGADILELLRQYARLENHLTQTPVSDPAPLLTRIAQFKKDKKIDFILQDLNNLVDESLEGVNRVTGIVQDMKTFARIDEAEFKPIDLNATLDATLNIVWNEIKYNAEVIKRYGELPLVNCYPQKISQVFMNLLVNAAQAIEGEGVIEIVTRVDNVGSSEPQRVVVAIADNGAGIAAEAISNIFDPFFTTKPPGQGTGLGLSISYDIIKAHGGDLTAASQPGQGAVFTVTLPVAPNQNGDAPKPNKRNGRAPVA